MDINLNDYVTTAQAAKQLDVNQESIVAAIARKKLPATKFEMTGKQYMILKTDLEEYVARTRPNGEKLVGRVPLAEKVTHWNRVPRILKEFIASRDDYADAKSLEWVEHRVTNREWAESGKLTKLASIGFRTREQQGDEPGLIEIEPVCISYVNTGTKGERYYIGRNDEAKRIYFSVVPSDMNEIVRTHGFEGLDAKLEAQNEKRVGILDEG